MRMNTFVGVAMAGLAALTVAGTGRADDAHKGHMEACAKVCSECMVECEKNAHHCFTLVEAGKKEHAKAMHLSADCAEFCTLSAKLSARHSPLAAAACEACAKACDACAAECEKFPDMPEMKACAAKCKECSASCKEMVKMMGEKK
jgi:hypothetical protein